MSHKRAFLLAKARQVVEMQDLRSHYDESQQLSVREVGRASLPLVMDDNFGYTESKTFRAPSDDDPDPEAEGCY